jgi:hypothetical protein
MATTIDRPPRKPHSPPNPRRLRPPPAPHHGARPPRLPPGRAERLLARFSALSALGAAVLGVLVTGVVALAVALSLGSGEPPPATGAAQLVPADALLYLHVSTDPSRPAVQRALALSHHLGGAGMLAVGVGNRLDAMLSGTDGGGLSYAADVRPWLGREAALAVLDTPGSSAGSLLVLGVRSRALARRFLNRVGARPAGTYRAVRLLGEPSGAELAFLRHYLVLGQPASVKAAIDVSKGKARSLAASGTYRQAAAHEPDDRVIDAYASAAGVRRALIPRAGILGIVGALLDTPDLSAASVSVSAVTGGLRVDVHRMLDPGLVRVTHDRPVSFAPSLTNLFPARSILLLDFHGLRASASKLLAVAARAGILGRVGPLFERLGSALTAEGVSLRQVLSVFSGETAVGVVPGSDGSAPAPVLVTRTSRPDRARAVLANLELPLTRVFTPPTNGPGQLPEVNDSVAAGVPVHQLSLAPGFSLSYAVDGGLVVVSTATAGIASVLRHHDSLSQASAFQGTVPDHPNQVSSLVFSDLSQLLRLGSRVGLIGTPRQSVISSVVGMIHAVGLTSWRGADDTTTELQLQTP